MKKTGTPRSRNADSACATSVASAQSSSSPIQLSNRSPRMYSACAWRASVARNRVNNSTMCGRAGSRCRSEMKSVDIRRLRLRRELHFDLHAGSDCKCHEHVDSEVFEFAAHQCRSSGWGELQQFRRLRVVQILFAQVI